MAPGCPVPNSIGGQVKIKRDRGRRLLCGRIDALLPFPIPRCAGYLQPGMIRRRTGNDFCLIAQHDHALLSGQLARHIGNKLFQPIRVKPAIVGIELHDCGWPLHDERPTLNEQGLPLDVFESPRSIALEVWQASADRAAQRDPYAALLVSLHVLSLSVNASTPTPQKHEKFDMAQAKTRFEVNRFQHNQIELQERLRRSLGMALDIPLRHGLAEESRDPRELALHYHFRLLQATDQISLALCCTQPPSDQIRPVLTRPGGKQMSLRVRRAAPTELLVSPWPFDVEQLEVATKFRRVPGNAYDELELFRRTYDAAKDETISFSLRGE
jgi:hypothetical protein